MLDESGVVYMDAKTDCQNGVKRGMLKEDSGCKEKDCTEGRVSKFKVSHSLCRAGVNYIP